MQRRSEKKKRKTKKRRLWSEGTANLPYKFRDEPECALPVLREVAHIINLLSSIFCCHMLRDWGCRVNKRLNYKIHTFSGSPRGGKKKKKTPWRRTAEFFFGKAEQSACLCRCRRVPGEIRANIQTGRGSRARVQINTFARKEEAN